MTDLEHAPVERDPDRVSGAAVFGGTRVPIYVLFHYLAKDQALAQFLDAFPHITRAQVLAVLELAKHQLTGSDDDERLDSSD
jgi:uncharacterized protein (DUF433 family)